MLHQAAHVLLHADEDPAEYVQHRGVKETEADGVNYREVNIRETPAAEEYVRRLDAMAARVCVVEDGTDENF